MSDASSNTLGLDFDNLRLTDPTTPPPPPLSPSASDPPPDHSKDKKKPYVNLERVNTGGSHRDKLSDEALTERMVRIREQNEKIKQRRLDVKADEDAFRQTQESERIKLAHNRKLQENIDKAREHNAKRKMDKIQSREWDSGKPSPDGKDRPRRPAESSSVDTSGSNNNFGGWTRGSPREGRGRGSRTERQRDLQKAEGQTSSQGAAAIVSPEESIAESPNTKA